jgi:hypothetical protein
MYYGPELATVLLQWAKICMSMQKALDVVMHNAQPFNHPESFSDSFGEGRL